MVGPLSGDEGIAVKDYAKTQPDITFVNGSSGAQATTLGDPSPNFFRFNTDGGAVDGRASASTRWPRATRRSSWSPRTTRFPYSQVQGFMAELLRQAGGKVVDQGVGAARHQGLLVGDRAHPEGRRRGLWSCSAAADAVNFLNQYEQAGGNKPMIGGSITVDQTVLNYKGKRRESLLGTASAGPIADSIDTPEWKKFVADYKATFKDGFPSPSLFAYLYYINTKATLDALDAVKGDLSGRPEEVPRGAGED